MIILEHSNPEILATLGPNVPLGDLRYNRFTIVTYENEGILVYNDYTKAFVLLSSQEYESPSGDTLNFLISNYFLVSKSYNEDAEADRLKKIKLSLKKSRMHAASQFTILPTTSCNARCFYCYEKGCTMKVMSTDTAIKVGNFITTHRDMSTPVKIHWFGGEPTCNIKAMDTICDTLVKNKVPFNSEITSNGYLLNSNHLDKMINKWNLKSAQITIDGPEDVYNKAKNFIYKDTSAFKVVMENIGLMLSNGIGVTIRLNVGPHNFDNIFELLHIIHNKFGNSSLLTIYAMPLFEDTVGGRTDEERKEVYSVVNNINEELFSLNYCDPNFDRKYPDSMCCADDMHAYLVLPDGKLGLCEHHTDDEFIGDIFTKNINFEKVIEWTERSPKLEICNECPFWAHCIKISHCPEQAICYKEERDNKIEQHKRYMREYLTRAKFSKYYQQQLLGNEGLSQA